MNRAVFIDKDGTLIKNVHYNADPAKVELERYAGTALYRLKQAGFMLVVISNQAGIALGYFTERELAEANKAMCSLLLKEGVALDAIYYCPHYVKGTVKKYAFNCGCRKPAAGLLVQAAKELRIQLAGSWMLGDITDDMEAGNKAGCSTILISSSPPGENTGWHMQLNEMQDPDYIVPDLSRAADIILSHSHDRYV